jgi:hypothetical protein
VPEKCSDPALTGGLCELEKGHAGKHRKTYATHTSEWDAESKQRFIKQYEQEGRW